MQTFRLFGQHAVVFGVVISLVVYVHKDNPVKGLTLAQVDAIFSKTCKSGLPNINV